MRIGIVTQSYLPIHGGVAEHVHHTAEELRHRGHDVTVVTAYFDRGDEDYSDGVVRIGHDLTIPMNGAFVNITVGMKLKAKLRAIEADKQFDVIHIHGPYEPVLPLLALRHCKAPKVGTFHTYAERSIGYAIAGGLLQQFANRLQVRIAVSEAAKTFISRYFPGEYRVIPNGVDTTKFRPDLERIPEMSADRKHVLFVGRMDPRKGLKYLLLAVPKIVTACPNAHFVIVGGGFLAGWYKRFIPEHLKDRVTFTGFVSSSQLPHFYSSADVYCSPATASESFGIVLLEAMAAGTPVVAFDNLGYRMLLSGGEQCSELVPNKNVDELAKAISHILLDDQHRAALTAAGVKKAARYAWPVVVEEIEAAYRDAIKIASGR